MYLNQNEIKIKSWSHFTNTFKDINETLVLEFKAL